MNRRNAMTLLAFASVAANVPQVLAAETQIQMLNSGALGTMVFEPGFVRIAIGDTITFIPTDKGHNAESIRNMLPEGAEPFKGGIGKEISVTFTVPGVYGVKCAPHFPMGMVALILVGDLPPSNLGAAVAAKQPGKAEERFKQYFLELNGPA